MPRLTPLPFGYCDRTLPVSTDHTWGAIRTEPGRASVVELDPYGPTTCALDARELRSLGAYCIKLAEALDKR